MEGTSEYVGALKGMSMMAGGRFVLLVGPAAGGRMTGEAGTKRIVRDMAIHSVADSTDPARVGTMNMWSIESSEGDTASYPVLSAERRVTGRDRGKAAVVPWVAGFFSVWDFSFPEWATEEVIVSGDAAIHRMSGWPS